MVSIITISVTTLSRMSLLATLHLKDTQHITVLSPVMLTVIMLSVVKLSVLAPPEVNELKLKKVIF